MSACIPLSTTPLLVLVAALASAFLASAPGPAWAASNGSSGSSGWGTAPPGGLSGGPGSRYDTPLASCPTGLPAQPLDLQQAIGRALCADPRTQQSQAAWQARQAQLQLERSQAWPEVSATVNAGQSRQRLRENGERTVSRAGVGSAALELSWVLLDFGQRQTSTQVAQWSALAAAAAHDDATLEVALATAAAFFAVAEAQALVQVLSEEARFADDFLAQNAQRAAAAAAPGATVMAARNTPARRAAAQRQGAPASRAATPAAAPTEAALDAELERLQLRADRSRAALERRLARGSLLQARSAFAAQLGLPLNADLQVLFDDTGGDPGWTDNTAETLLQEVLREHPALRAARARLSAADAGLESARRSAAPRLSLQHSLRAGRDVLRSDSRENVVGLQLEVPLFAGFARQHRESLARADVASARAELRSTEQQVALQTWSAYQAYQTYGVAALQAQRYETDARALLAGELASYRAGNSDLHDVLDAQSTISEATLARLSSQTALRLARVRLAASLGRLHQGSHQSLQPGLR